MIVHVTSNDDLCSLDMMFYDCKSMFPKDSFGNNKKIVLRKTSLRTIISRKGHLRQMIILQSCVYKSYVYERLDYESMIYGKVPFSVLVKL